MSGRKEDRISGIFDDLGARLDRLAGAEDLDRESICQAFAKIEHLLLLVKLEHGFESPGGFKPVEFKDRDRSSILEIAIDNLQQARAELQEGDVGRAVKNLRIARDALKSLFLKA